MLEDVKNAYQNQDYQTLTQLLKQWQKQDPNNPWLHLYIAKLKEALGQPEQAEEFYRKLLKNNPIPQIITQARQGLARIEAERQKLQNEEFSLAKEKLGGDEMGVFILGTVPVDKKPEISLKLSQFFKTDRYTTRLQLPSRSTRLYRTGSIGELRYFVEKLTAQNVPCCAFSLSQINSITVYPVEYFQLIYPQGSILYKTPQKEQNSFTFDWSDITHIIQGLVPIFEESLEIDAKSQTYRKTKILDYAKVCDLYLKKQNTILRTCDYTYQFKAGIPFSPYNSNPLENTTTSHYWTFFLNFLQEKLPQIPLNNEFTPFGESAVDFQEFLKLIPPHLDLFRRKESPWDAAFHLYSCSTILGGREG